MYIIQRRDGQRKILTGWRAWLIAVPVIALGVLAAITVIGIVLGIAFTVATFLLIAIPIVLLLALLAGALRRSPPRFWGGPPPR